MLWAAALSASLVVGAADSKSEAWVVVTKRSGVAKPAAMEFAKTIADALAKKGVPNPAEPGDLTSCNARLMCLMEEAMKKKVSLIVTIEAASVLDDVVIHSEALSVDEDGKKVSTFDYEGPAKGFSADAAKRVDDLFAPAIRSTLGIGATPVAKEAPKAQPVAVVPPPAKPEPTVVAAPAEPPPAVAASSAPGMSTQKKAAIGVAAAGAVSLIVGGAMGGKALGSAGTKNSLCPAGAPCTNPAAFTAYDDARSAQTIGTVFAVAGGVLVAAGVVLFVVDFGGGASVSATPSASPGGAGVLLHGRF